ncbi:MAG: DUF2182 domain-containing protein [Sphingomonas sp.]|uniref:DUF2182 domain-containing protein n=1 Tax=Sphingomonas sp. TaxID=28214 RepID=UPI0017B8A01C|nr:DUF2182 domain-containing protein [Sphingomonas sp.]MBA3667328.1 DUF2182 domain-containing protein [Sphingomonas sp.]
MEARAVGLFRHSRTVTIVALIVLALLAWGWLLAGAGMHRSGEPMAAMSWDSAHFGLTWSMWAVMMVAMMLPSASPIVLLYGHAARRQGRSGGAAPFLIGYLTAWGLFSLLATGLQFGLQQSGLVDAMTMGASSRSLTAGLLIAAGFYQLTPPKQACLAHCRNPAEFIARHHRASPLTIGLLHGSWCVGCCWALMLLLFAGGVMNLVWVAALTLLVAAEKLLPFGHRLPRFTAPLLIGCGAILLVRL